jgi:hypothetical protein
MKSLWFVAALAFSWGVPLGASAGSNHADVALVLAIDVSGSINDHHFKLQREGVAAALESEELAAALSNGVNQAIEIAVLEWAEEQHLLVPWTVLRGQEDIEALATRLRGANRSWLHTKTDPGGGIAAAEQLFAAQPLAAHRRVIDVSGDGRQNTGEVTTADARDAAVSHGLTVNGLPITSGEPGIEDWYRANVVGGPGAFLVVADSYDAFATAFRQKLTVEISGLAPARSWLMRQAPCSKPTGKWPVGAKLGPGISEELADTIFDPFVTTMRPGMGMGLSVSRSIIESHAGDLRARRNVPCGAIFSFDLPTPEAQAGIDAG